ncbi:MAG: response regulator [Pirellulales bacterium]|nr:response regulator [Pirellulales bacterium]
MMGQPPTVLHIEDNPDHAHLVDRSLKKHQRDCIVYLVEDGETALDYLLRRDVYQDPRKSPRPCLILLDLRLPRIDGLEVLRTIKTAEDLLSIPVVILTSSEAEKDVAEAYRYHANSYLVKPVGFAEFSKLMDDLALYWLGWNRSTLSGERTF